MAKMHGGLIRKEPRVESDRRGNTTTQHWDGRKDVTINAERAQILAKPKAPGGKD